MCQILCGCQKLNCFLNNQPQKQRKEASLSNSFIESGVLTDDVSAPHNELLLLIREARSSLTQHFMNTFRRFEANCSKLPQFDTSSAEMTSNDSRHRLLWHKTKLLLVEKSALLILTERRLKIQFVFTMIFHPGDEKCN